MIIYADENIEEAIIQGLRRRGIDVVSARDEGFIGKDNDFHLRQAKQIGKVELVVHILGEEDMRNHIEFL